MNMTSKTLLLLSGLIAVSIFAPIDAKADMHKKTSSLVISNEVYMPTQDVHQAGETDMMPITAEPVEPVHHIAVEASSAPATLTPMPTANLIVEETSLVIQPDIKIALSWRGRSGETLQNVITRWGGRDGKDLHWRTKDTSQLHRHFSFFGTFDEAVAELLIREVKPASYVEEYTVNKKHLYTGLKKNE